MSKSTKVIISGYYGQIAGLWCVGFDTSGSDAGVKKTGQVVHAQTKGGVVHSMKVTAFSGMTPARDNLPETLWYSTSGKVVLA